MSIFDDVVDVVHTLPGTKAESIVEGLRLLLGGSEIVMQMKTEQWLTSRQWPLLSMRLLNIIDGIANSLSPYARHL